MNGCSKGYYFVQEYGVVGFDGNGRGRPSWVNLI